MISRGSFVFVLDIFWYECSLCDFYLLNVVYFNRLSLTLVSYIGIVLLWDFCYVWRLFRQWYDCSLIENVAF